MTHFESAADRRDRVTLVEPHVHLARREGGIGQPGDHRLVAGCDALDLFDEDFVGLVRVHPGAGLFEKVRVGHVIPVAVGEQEGFELQPALGDLGEDMLAGTGRRVDDGAGFPGVVGEQVAVRLKGPEGYALDLHVRRKVGLQNDAASAEGGSDWRPVLTLSRVRQKESQRDSVFQPGVARSATPG